MSLPESSEQWIEFLRNHIGLIVFVAIVAICIWYIQRSIHSAKKTAEAAKKKADEEKKKHDHHAQTADPHGKSHGEDAHGAGHHEGKKQTFADNTMTFLWQLLFFVVICLLILYLGVPWLKKKGEPSPTKNTRPTIETTTFDPPADTSLTVSLPQGKKTLVIVTKTYWYSDVMDEGTVADLIVEEPTQQIQFYPDVSTENQPTGLHIPPGSKVYYKSKTPNGKVHVSHF